MKLGTHKFVINGDMLLLGGCEAEFSFYKFHFSLFLRIKNLEIYFDDQIFMNQGPFL